MLTVYQHYILFKMRDSVSGFLKLSRALVTMADEYFCKLCMKCLLLNCTCHLLSHAMARCVCHSVRMSKRLYASFSHSVT